MKNKEENSGYYRTEEELKAEAKQQAAERARIQAAKPTPSQGKKKADNFWYHYKWHTIGGVVALLLVVFFVRDVLFRTDPDATIILATSTPLPTETTDALQQALEAVAGDFNGDGKVSIAVDAIYMPAATEPAVGAQSAQEDIAANMGGQSDYASVMKLTTVIAAGLDPIYLLDDDLYAHMLQMAAGSEQDAQGNVMYHQPTEEHALTVFERLDAADGQLRIPLAATSLAGDAGLDLVMDTAFSLRVQAGDKNAEYHAYCRALLEALVAAQPG